MDKNIYDKLKHLEYDQLNVLLDRLGLEPSENENDDREEIVSNILLECENKEYLNKVYQILKEMKLSSGKGRPAVLKEKVEGAQSEIDQSISFKHQSVNPGYSFEKNNNVCRNVPPNSKKPFFFYFALIALVAVPVAFVMRDSQNQKTFPLDHYYVTPKVFQLKINDMTKTFLNQEDMSWQKINKLGYKHLERVFKYDTSSLKPFTMLIAGYNGTSLTMKCFLKELGLAFTNKSYDTLTSEGANKESLDKQIQESLNSFQKYVVVTNIEQMTYDTASIFMSYADEYVDSTVISFPQSTIIMTAEMPFSFPENNINYNRLKEEEKIMKYFVNEIWGPDKNKASALWSRIGNVVILLKPESLTNFEHCN
ncbi:uncharacterized protein LOC136079753 [Hydra vulgaris]|uniref:Uncharacterized protein LOC136079753 n=1 Tax=Hydra vulgaris TaxID=6087 RepID=A0ABM4BSK2_HYDVU